MSQLWFTTIENREGIWGGVFGQSLEEKSQENKAQSGYQNKKCKSDHIACHLQFEFDFGLI